MNLDDITDDQLMEDYVTAFMAFNPDVGPCKVDIDEEGKFFVTWAHDEKTFGGLFREDLHTMIQSLRQAVIEHQTLRDRILAS